MNIANIVNMRARLIEPVVLDAFEFGVTFLPAVVPTLPVRYI